MVEIEELLKRVDNGFAALELRLASIERSLANPNLRENLVKSHYSCAEVAELTQQFGTKKVKPFTIRLACSDGRVPDAEKASDNSWHIPKEAVLRILSEGLPPERRKRSAVETSSLPSAAT